MDFDPADDDWAEVNPVAVLLVACLANQISELGRLRRLGAWKDDPAEISDWLKREYGAGGEGVSLRRDAVWEWMLWTGRKTEALCEWLEAEVGVVVDPGRILAMAKARGAETSGSAQGRHMFRANGAAVAGGVRK